MAEKRGRGLDLPRSVELDHDNVVLCQSSFDRVVREGEHGRCWRSCFAGLHNAIYLSNLTEPLRQNGIYQSNLTEPLRQNGISLSN